MKKIILLFTLLISTISYSQKISDMTEVTTTSSNSVLPIVDYATGLNRKIKLSNLVTSGGYLTTGVNTYTANTVIAPTGTFSLTASGLTTIGSTSLTISSSSLKLSAAGTPGANKVLTSDANGYATWQTPTTISSGTYTPTFTNTTNVSASTANPTYWYRIGDEVTVYGTASVDITTTLLYSKLEFSLPIASDFTQGKEVGGTGTGDSEATINMRFLADVTNNTAYASWTGQVITSNIGFSFHFSYHIQ